MGATSAPHWGKLPRMNRPLTLLLCLSSLNVLADGSGATKAPPGYFAFLPFLAGGVHDKALSNPPKSIVLGYAETWESVAKKMHALLEKEGFTFEPDDIPGMSGVRYVARKGENAAYFTIKPDSKPKKTLMLVTDVTGAPR